MVYSQICLNLLRGDYQFFLCILINYHQIGYKEKFFKRTLMEVFDLFPPSKIKIMDKQNLPTYIGKGPLMFIALKKNSHPTPITKMWGNMQMQFFDSE
jgi:hypothetical protein